MTAKDYLKQLNDIDNLINLKLDSLQKINELRLSVSAVAYDKPKVQTSGSNDASFTQLTEREIELQNEINKLTDEYVDFQRKIESQFKLMKHSLYGRVLQKIYVNKKDAVVIGSELGYSPQYVYECHLKALNEFELMYSNDFEKII